MRFSKNLLRTCHKWVDALRHCGGFTDDDVVDSIWAGAHRSPASSGSNRQRAGKCVTELVERLGVAAGRAGNELLQRSPLTLEPAVGQPCLEAGSNFGLQLELGERLFGVHD